MPAQKRKPVNHDVSQVKNSLDALAVRERLSATAVFLGNGAVVDLQSTPTSQSTRNRKVALTQTKKLQILVNRGVAFIGTPANAGA